MNQHYKNIAMKLLLIFILLFVIGLPINNQLEIIILLFFIPIIIFSEISLKKRSVYFTFCIILIYSVFKFAFGTLDIHEGHNVVLLNDNSDNFYKENLPKEVYNFFNNEFNIHYSNSQCEHGYDKCWKYFNPNRNNHKSSPTNNIFAFSSDWIFKKIKFSRIVSNINFTNIKSARIGAINNLDYNYFSRGSADVYRENTPFFVMYVIPSELQRSFFCWKGNLFWEQNNGSYLRKYNNIYKCTQFEALDVGKKIFGTSMGSKNQLILKLEKSLFLKFKEIFLNLFKLFIIAFIIKLFLRFNHNIYIFSIVYFLAFILLIYYVNKNLLYGFDIFSGGNDGILYMSYGNVIFNNLINFNFYEAFKGVENVFYFPSSLRYFWPINKIFFGESIYGYLLIAFLYPFLLFNIFKYLFGTKWSIVLTTIVFLTRLFEGYALCVVNTVQHINAGDAEPLAIFFVLSSLLIFIKITNGEIKINSIFYNIIFGFFLFLSVSLRPNYFPTGIIFIFALLFYNFYYHKNIKSFFLIIFGFLPILLIPFHNYYYGNSSVFFSSASHYNTHAPVSVYYDVIKDLIYFNINDNIDIIIRQFNRWIQPKEIHYIITFIIVLFLLLKNNSNYLIKTLCLLALSQHLVLLVFEPANRYAYLAWILTIILNLYFIKYYLLELKFINKIKKIIL